MAADIAPGLLRAEAPPVAAHQPTDPAARARFGDRKAAAGGRSGTDRAAPAFGFLRWHGHDAHVWQTLVAEAQTRRAEGLEKLRTAGPHMTIRGSDRDASAIKLARACAGRAGLGELVAFEPADLDQAEPAAARGLVAANAPYGERLDAGEAEAVYRQLGERLRTAFADWNAVVLAGDDHQVKALGLTPGRSTPLRNGPLDCVLSYFAPGAAPTGSAAPRSARAAVRSAAPRTERPPETAGGPAKSPAPPTAPGDPAAPSGGAAPATRSALPHTLGGGAEYLANRLHKNQRRLARRLQREGITCYRLYDADLPEYNLVVDVYGDWVHVQEYAAPPEIDPDKAQRRLADAVEVIGAVLQVPAGHVVLKERRRQRGAAQYERRRGTREQVDIREDDLTYSIDLGTYLDTGFFIDQRLTRRLVRRLAGGRRFLNLFAYTGSMTVNALAGGSPSSTTVDLSANYLEWAGRNLAANGFAFTREVWPATGPAGAAPVEATAPPSHALVQADCLRWVAQAGGQYDLIWLDPPTFSNSKKMGRATFDVQRDHADLIRLVARRLLAPGGVLLFATNLRNFRLERSELGGLEVKDLSRATLAFDCERGANRHHVFRVERR
jgi:23S rRNA (guanine2445-N2)-methyltransferase / 23S rRNA (guanine2069-N7)-methyltransferase